MYNSHGDLSRVCSIWEMMSIGVLRGVVSKVAREVAKTPQGFEVGCDQNLDLARSPEARENVASRGPDGKLEMRPG